MTRSGDPRTLDADPTVLSDRGGYRRPALRRRSGRSARRPSMSPVPSRMRSRRAIVQVVARPAEATRVLTVRATAAQLAQVKAKLAPYEAAGSTTCATRPAP